MELDHKKFKEIKAALTLDDDTLHHIADDFRAEMHAGLAH